MWVHNLNPTLVSLGPLEIRWYGIAYVLGFFIAVFWLKYLSKKGEIKLNSEQIWDFGFYLMLGMLIGARLFQLIWYPEYYFSNLLNLFKIWQGGMSFHGGLTGIIVAGWIYCKVKKVNFWKMADALSVPTMFALALGRIANFINGELIGTKTNVNWCIDYGDGMCRHPSTLYAAAKRFLVFGWLLYLGLKNKFKAGFIFLNFLLFEGLGRFIVDFYREDTLYIKLSLGQWMSLVMIFASLYFIIIYYKEDVVKIFKKSVETS